MILRSCHERDPFNAIKSNFNVFVSSSQVLPSGFLTVDAFGPRLATLIGLELAGSYAAAAVLHAVVDAPMAALSHRLIHPGKAGKTA